MTKAIVILVALTLVFGWFALVRHIEHWADKEFGGDDDGEKSI